MNDGAGLSPRKDVELTWREALDSDLGLLADWNQQLIRDEGHRNRMTVAQLEERMRQWFKGEYRAILFSSDEPVCYALFKPEAELIYLRQFFVRRDRRESGIGRAAFTILKEKIWPAGVRLTVEVLSDNPAGIAFWRSVGYRDHCLTLEIMP